MLTDSGGYQIFSMGHGSVGDEIKGRRGVEGGAQFGTVLRLMIRLYVAFLVSPRRCRVRGLVLHVSLLLMCGG